MATTLRGRPVDPYALPPEAGTRPNYGNERTSECLVDEDRPPTPDRYKKWRKSTYSVPGTRIIHPGGVDDWRDVKHPEFFGVRKKDPGEGEHVDDVLAQPGAESEYAQTKLTQAERHYHSTRMEPLGKCFSHEAWHQEAVGEFREALEGIEGTEKERELPIRYDLMLSLIDLARENNSMEEAREAAEICSAIVRKDIGYRDIRVKRKEVDALIKEIDG